MCNCVYTVHRPSYHCAVFDDMTAFSEVGTRIVNLSSRKQTGCLSHAWLSGHCPSRLTSIIIFTNIWINSHFSYYYLPPCTSHIIMSNTYTPHPHTDAIAYTGRMLFLNLALNWFGTMYHIGLRSWLTSQVIIWREWAILSMTCIWRPGFPRLYVYTHTSKATAGMHTLLCKWDDADLWLI